MKAPATDGCDNRAPQSPTTSLVRHFTSDPQTRSVTLLTIPRRPAAEPHRTGRHASRTHTHTHRPRSFTFFARRRVGRRDRSRFTHPEASISAAKGTARHATEPQTRERPSPLTRPWDTHTHTDTTPLRTARIPETTAVHSLSSHSSCRQPPSSTHQRSGFCRPVAVAEPDDPGFRRSRRAPHRPPNTTTIAPQGRALSVDL